MGIGGGVDDDAVHLAVCPLDFVHNVPFVVGLVLLHFQILGAGGFVQQPQKIGEGAFTVDTRFRMPSMFRLGPLMTRIFIWVPP